MLSTSGPASVRLSRFIDKDVKCLRLILEKAKSWITENGTHARDKPD